MLTESTEDTHRTCFECILLPGTVVHKGAQWKHNTVGEWVALSPLSSPPSIDRFKFLLTRADEFNL